MIFTDVHEPLADDINQLKKGLLNFNAPYTTGLIDESVACFIKDSEGLVLGGALAKIYWGWLYIEWLWVDQSLRGKNAGTELLDRVEAYALKQSVSNFRLETTSFQALDFYLKRGYEVFAELADMPPGETTYYLKKNAAA